ncbi:MAG: hypothetical protein MUP19_09800 [Candidatus Aminicenantes bacterium]|nr:hypothetical protein [Candidatus Aminicenantes bacterium]
MPADTDDQYAYLKFQGRPGEQSEGKISSSRLAINKAAVPKGFCWRDPFNYKVEFGPMGADFPAQHILHCQGAPTIDEIMEGLRVGQLKKVYNFSAQYKEPIPHGFSYSLQGTVTMTIAFAPYEEERWRVTVVAREQDKIRPPITYTDKTGAEIELPIWMEIGHTIVGEFVIRKVKAERTYKSGQVAKYEGWSQLHFNAADLYKCDTVPCPGLDSEPGYSGQVLRGEVDNHSLKLEWTKPGIRAKACVFCKPLKSYVGKIPYRQEFGAGDDLFFNLSKEILPLKNGSTKTGKVSDWLTYTITLTKIK